MHEDISLSFQALHIPLNDTYTHFCFIQNAKRETRIRWNEEGGEGKWLPTQGGEKGFIFLFPLYIYLLMMNFQFSFCPLFYLIHFLRLYFFLLGSCFAQLNRDLRLFDRPLLHFRLFHDPRSLYRRVRGQLAGLLRILRAAPLLAAFILL